MSLVIWIAVMKLLILFLLIYVDDSFSFQCRGQMTFYKKYGKHLPSNLTKLLHLWDFFGLPHEPWKQIFGSELLIIGFNVEPNLMRVRMSDESCLQLISVLRDFAQHGMRHTLRDFQQIAGYLNWALNVYPMLRPGLCAVYAKTSGKSQHKALIWVNRDVERELTWAVDHLLHSKGICFLKSVSWCYNDLPESVVHVYCDALPLAMAFWFPSTNLGYQAFIQDSEPHDSIFFYEALTVCGTILVAVMQLSPGSRLAVFTNNLNTMQLFNSLAALPSMNWMVIQAINTLLDHDIDFWVFHVPGAYNVVADHLSDNAMISPFNPLQAS
ncbi:hypothetical protein BU15DRAFT_72791 [Melanogaster broomeanus]|nr:hypothetical protein BU15DRAFT_72791 [Melanogaster broomeanus]